MTLSRRQFLRQSMMAGIASATIASPITGLNQILAAAGNVTSSYKAMVCIFLFGGNDGFNMVIPNESAAYATYANSRQNLAVPQADLLPVGPASGGEFGFHPAMSEVRQLFESGRLAVQANVGTLIRPVTREMIQNNTAVLPPQLFSHNDQQALWSAASASDFSNRGWGGLVADQLSALNNSLVPMNISIFGNNLFQVGETVSPYSMNPSGPEEMIGVRSHVAQEANRAAVFQRLRDAQSTHVLEMAHKNLTRNTQEVAQVLNTALEVAPELQTQFPAGNFLGSQLEMVAKMISISESLGFERQIFFVGMGGFDSHDRQNADQPILLGELSQALASFYEATEELGVAEQVTSFTLSDFGRTLTSNGDGTDHGWGSHHMIMGGAVNGGDLYGVMPELAIGGPDDADDGRMIPTTSVDQYSATIARWFGLSEAQLGAVFPNLNNFNRTDMGFMNLTN